jgi:hypothetical protein
LSLSEERKRRKGDLEKEKRRGHTIEGGAPSLRGGHTKGEEGAPKVEKGALIDRKGRSFQDSKQPSEKGTVPKARARTSKA